MLTMVEKEGRIDRGSQMVKELSNDEYLRYCSGRTRIQVQQQELLSLQETDGVLAFDGCTPEVACGFHGWRTTPNPPQVQEGIVRNRAFWKKGD